MLENGRIMAEINREKSEGALKAAAGAMESSEIGDQVRGLAISVVKLSHRVEASAAGALLVKECLSRVLAAGIQLDAGERTINGPRSVLLSLRQAIYFLEIISESSLAPQAEVLPPLDQAYRICTALRGLVPEEGEQQL